MNGLILIKTSSPLHLFLNRFIGYQSVGFMIEGKIYLIDEFGLYEHNFNLGLDLEIFKQYYTLQSLQVAEIKVTKYWQETVLQVLNNHRKQSPEDIIAYLIKNKKINNTAIHSIDIVYSVLIKLSIISHLSHPDFTSWFEEWKPITLPVCPINNKRLKQEEINNKHKPMLKRLLNVMIDLMIENPNYFVNPYRFICQMLLGEMDKIILKEEMDINKIIEIKKLYKQLENL